PSVQPSSAASAASQCPAVVPVRAQQLRHQSVPSSDASHCHLSVLSISTHHQCHLSVPPICDTSLVLPISAAYPCHLIRAAYQCPSVLPISALQCSLINAHQ
ncbi:unnamed protein product, partial [Staurois parvus]